MTNVKKRKRTGQSPHVRKPRRQRQNSTVLLNEAVKGHAAMEHDDLSTSSLSDIDEELVRKAPLPTGFAGTVEVVTQNSGQLGLSGESAASKEKDNVIALPPSASPPSTFIGTVDATGGAVTVFEMKENAETEKGFASLSNESGSSKERDCGGALSLSASIASTRPEMIENAQTEKVTQAVAVVGMKENAETEKGFASLSNESGSSKERDCGGALSLSASIASTQPEMIENAQTEKVTQAVAVVGMKENAETEKGFASLSNESGSSKERDYGGAVELGASIASTQPEVIEHAQTEKDLTDPGDLAKESASSKEAPTAPSAPTVPAENGVMAETEQAFATSTLATRTDQACHAASDRVDRIVAAETGSTLPPSVDVTVVGTGVDSTVGKLHDIVDVAKLKPTRYVPIDGYGNAERSVQYAALHRCLDGASYARVMNYALAAGCSPDLVNLAACDPQLFKWGEKGYVTDLEENVVRFFLTGLTAAPTQLFGRIYGKNYKNNGRSSIELMPAVAVGRRALGAIAAFEEWSTLRTYAKNGALNLSTLCQSKHSAGSIATETDTWPTTDAHPTPVWRRNVLEAFCDVPLYDGRKADFDITNFQSLPRVDRDLPKGSVVSAVFTLKKYGSPVTVGFNIMAVIWLAEGNFGGAETAAMQELPHLKIV